MADCSQNDTTVGADVNSEPEITEFVFDTKPRPYWHVIVSLILSVTATIAFIYGGYKLMAFFMPFVIGWFISYIANPLVLWLEKRLKIIKKLSSAIIIVLVLAGILSLGYLALSKLVSEISVFVQNFPEIYSQIEGEMTHLGNSLNGVYELLPQAIQTAWEGAVDNFRASMGNLVSTISQPTFEIAGNIAKRVPSMLVATIVTIVSSYFFIAQREEVIALSKRIAPKSLQSRMTLIIDNFKTAVGGYFQAQFKIMAVVAVILFIGMIILDVKYAIIVALLVALLDFLPFFGTGTVLIPWALVCLINGEYRRAIALVVIYAVTQLVRQVIQPKLVGDSIGMNPLATLFLLYMGYKVGALLGMILAVPVGMIVLNLYKSGAFDYILDDVKILIDGALKLRGK